VAVAVEEAVAHEGGAPREPLGDAQRAPLADSAAEGLGHELALVARLLEGADEIASEVEGRHRSDGGDAGVTCGRRSVASTPRAATSTAAMMSWGLG
jgi:hypothetical protein